MIGAYAPLQTGTPIIRLGVDRQFPRRRSTADPLDQYEKGGSRVGISRSSLFRNNDKANRTRRVVLLAVLAALITVAFLLMSLINGSLRVILESYSRRNRVARAPQYIAETRPVPTMYHYNTTETRTINVLNTKTVSATVYDYKTQIIFTTPTAIPRASLPFELDLGVYPDANKHLLHPTDSSIQQIPSIVHYVWLSGIPGKSFNFLQYISFASAVVTLRPEKIILWRDHEPSGWYWTRLLKFAKQKNVRIVQMPARSIESIFGNPVNDVAHKADILRLEALKLYGGIYLDLDVFVIKDFAPFYNRTMVMAQEAEHDHLDRLEPSGLRNGVIMAQPYARFITRWLDSYKTFDDRLSTEHSLSVPWRLAKQHMDDITVLSKKAIFYPLWHKEHISLVHESLDHDFDEAGQLAYHAWSHAASIDHYNPINVWTRGDIGRDGVSESSFTRLIRRWADDDLRKDYVDAKSKGLVE